MKKEKPYTMKDWERDVRKKEMSDFVGSMPEKAKEFWKNEKKNIMILAPRLFVSIEMAARYKMLKMAARQARL